MIMAENRSTLTVATAEGTPGLWVAGFDQCLDMYVTRTNMPEARRSIRRRAGEGIN